ncbi:hypothetical protein A5791_14225 [Mycobacterium sp. 852002-51163_SCH5372311]|nr:hypothetical protein A5791_14225 [Mycobacterium sp. 852002-51163_SCH5372311]
MSSWRPITWCILGLQVLFVIWLIVNVISGFDACSNQHSDGCRAGEAIGTKIGMGIFILLCVDVLLGVLWVVTSKTDTGPQTCPACGHNMTNGLPVCPGCGFDIGAATPGQDPPGPLG